VKTIYLAGPINGCSDEEACGWRRDAKELLGPEYLVKDPMVRDYRGKEANNYTELVNADLKYIALSYIILVNATRPSWGTAMEMAYAHMMHKLIVVVAPEGPISPWVHHHSNIIGRSLSAAIHHLKIFEEL
jgi:hypothetical protein